jgi:hypothetical protein
MGAHKAALPRIWRIFEAFERSSDDLDLGPRPRGWLGQVPPDGGFT